MTRRSTLLPRCCPDVAPTQTRRILTKINLTDRFIASRKAAPAGCRQDYPDAIVPGLALRVTDRGHKSFVLVARYPSNPANPTRRALGDYGAVSLDKARAKARGWLELIGQGKDPKIEQERQRALEQRRQAVTFAAVASEFLGRHAAGLAKAEEARRIVQGEFVKRWGNRPIADLLPEEVAAAIRAIVKRGAPYQAHNAFGYLRRLFNWAIGTNEFGLTASPVEHLRPADLIGKRESRDRTLTDDELRAAWEAAGEMGYPYGPLFRLLILNGQRENEIAEAQRAEFQADKRLLTIPAERMKGKRAHEVPLAPDALAIFEGIPRFSGGPFLFTTTNGEKPVNGFSKAKRRLDKLTLKKLRAIGAERGDVDLIARVDCFEALLGTMEGDDKEAAEIAAGEFKREWWVLHDLRRTMRTHLSALPVDDMVRELVIAHAKKGLHKVYDQHAYLAEKRRCLGLWEARLAHIVKPESPTVCVSSPKVLSKVRQPMSP